MAATPAGYEAFHSFGRKSITLICFVLASTMAIGITVYVDSYSVHEWNRDIDVGSVAIIVSGNSVGSYVTDIRNIASVTKAASLRSGYGTLILNASETHYVSGSGPIMSPSNDFYETFPNYIQIDLGRTPVSPDEIVILNMFHLNEGIQLGDNVSLYTYDAEHNVTVVGFYSTGDETESPYSYRPYSIAIVNRSLISYADVDVEVYVDVDRSSISAFNPTAALQYLNGIDEAIRSLDPNYIPGSSGYYSIRVENRLSSGISGYMNWVFITRITEMLRVSSIFFLLILVDFLVIRHNVNERRYEESMLFSRGAAKGDLEKITTREIFILSLLSCVAGIPTGLLLSRVAIASTGFFTFNAALFISEPILISLDSLIISIVVTIALPMLTLGGYRAFYSTKKNIDEDRGRLSKLSRGLDLIRWDLLIVGISGLFLFAMITGGTAATSNPLLALILPIIPIPLFLGMASLSMKVLKWGAYGLSVAMRRVVGDIPASIGIRRVGKGSSSAGAAAMILVLAICLSWNSAIIDASMPITALNQSRLAIGSDLTFALNENELDSWNEFMTNVTNHGLVKSGTLVSEAYLYLSAGYEGGTNFFAVNPREYKNVGYDYLGNPLNESALSTLFDNLESTTDGAIITSDIADAYKFEVGDIVRASTLDEGASTLIFRIIGITEALPEVPQRSYYYPYYFDEPYYPPGYYYTSQVVGTSRILVNREYLGSQLTLQNSSYNYFCVRTSSNVNASIIAEDVIQAGGGIALYNGLWKAVSQNVQEYIGGTQYKMERSLDTMLTVLTVGTIVGGFAIYSVEGVRNRKREIALLRSIGATKSTIVLTLGAEMFVVMLFSMMLLLIYAPLFLNTTITMAGGSTTGPYLLYPVAIFPVIPWTTIFVVLGFFIVSVALFIIVIAFLGSRINLASTLNAAWAEAGPYGGDM